MSADPAAPSLWARMRSRLAHSVAPKPPAPSRGPVALWDGAQRSRLTSDWLTPALSANQEIQIAGRMLRLRARALVQNNGYAAGFVTEAANNVVGPDGIQLRMQLRTQAGALASATNDEIERGWRDWGLPESASADGHDGWVDCERLLMQSIVVDGEAFVRLHRGADTPYAFAVELIDPDLVDDTYHRAAAPNVNEIRMGVELGAFNRPVAYHVWTRYLGDQGGVRERVRIGAEDLLHLFMRTRVGQVRGVSWFAPVLLPFKMLAGYEEAELVAARVAASKMAFLVPDVGADVDPNAPANVPSDTEPGSFPELPPGYTVQNFDPQHPTQAFAAFTSAILRGIGRGLGASYLTITGDVSAANYSSMRAGFLPERDHWRGVQKWFARACHRRVFNAWLEMALLVPNALRVDSRLASKYRDGAQWMPRGWKWVDPLKDATALMQLISLGLESRTRAAAEAGDDFEELIDELKAESDYAEQEGVDISGEQSKARPQSDTPAAPPQPEGAPDGTGTPSTGAHASPRLAVL